MKEFEKLRMLKAVLATANRFQENRRRQSPITSINALRTEMQQLRSAMRDKTNLLPGWLAKQEQAMIENTLQSLLIDHTRTNVDIEFGKAKALHRKILVGSRRPTLKITVGHMWHRRIWLNLYFKHRFINAKDYLILSAIEYKTNVKNIKLWKVMVFSFKEKKTIEGYIGQSKFDMMPCTFRLDMHGAINAAVKLTANAVSEKLGLGEHDND